MANRQLRESAQTVTQKCSKLVSLPSRFLISKDFNGILVFLSGLPFFSFLGEENVCLTDNYYCGIITLDLGEIIW
jgi:hypothetical protein